MLHALVDWQDTPLTVFCFPAHMRSPGITKKEAKVSLTLVAHAHSAIHSNNSTLTYQNPLPYLQYSSLWSPWWLWYPHHTVSGTALLPYPAYPACPHRSSLCSGWGSQRLGWLQLWGGSRDPCHQNEPWSWHQLSGWKGPMNSAKPTETPCLHLQNCITGTFCVILILCTWKHEQSTRSGWNLGTVGVRSSCNATLCIICRKHHKTWYADHFLFSQWLQAFGTIGLQIWQPSTDPQSNIVAISRPAHSSQCQHPAN